MSVISQLLIFEQTAITRLNEVQTYYQDTLAVWAIVQRLVREQNPIATVDSTNGKPLFSTADLSQKARTYTTGYLAESTFLQFNAIFETFFFDLLEVWLFEYNHLLENRQFDVDIVRRSVDKNEILRFIVQDAVNKLKYENPRDWFKKRLNKYLRAQPLTDEQIDALAEIKASRDIIIHNQGIVNQTYLIKAATKARFSLDEQICISHDYHQDTLALLTQLIQTISQTARHQAVNSVISEQSQ
jgi:hypothetical protein